MASKAEVRKDANIMYSYRSVSMWPAQSYQPHLASSQSEDTLDLGGCEVSAADQIPAAVFRNYTNNCLLQNHKCKHQTWVQVRQAE